MNSFSHIAQLLNKGTALACSFYIALRAISPGLDLTEPEGRFLTGIAFLAAFLCALSLLTRGIWLAPQKSFWLPLTILVGLVVYSVNTASAIGNYQLALDLGNMWLSDLFILSAVGVSCCDLAARRMYLSCLAGGVVVACIYGVYQKFYALEYMRRIFAGSDSVYATNEQLAKGFGIRLGSERVSGPYAYANSLAAVAALGLPLLWRQAVTAIKYRYIFFLALILVLCGVLFSGSKAGTAAIVFFQAITFYYLAEVEERNFYRWLKTCGTAILAMLPILVVYRILSIAGWDTGGMIIVATGWAAILLWLPEFVERGGKRLTAILGYGGILFSVVAVFAVVFFIFSTENNQQAKKLRTEINTQLGVRVNYWRAGLRILSDYPLRGVGLDNFGERYSEYKTSEGWEVRRAHNHYLQLAVDGGVPLLLAFVVFIFFFFMNRAVKKDGLCGDKFYLEQPLAFKIGMISIVAAFVVTYVMCLSGSFTGLGLEFILTEIAGAKGSIIQESGSYSGMLIHGLVHLLILPGAFIVTYLYCWHGAIEKLDNYWLKIGIATVLLQAFFDFTLYHAAVSGLFCVSMALARGYKPLVVRLSDRIAKLAITITIILAMFLFIKYLQPGLEGSVATNRGDKIIMGAKDYKDFKAAFEIYNEALEKRPDDGLLRLHRAEVMLRLLATEPSINQDYILAEYDKIISLAPYSTSSYLAKSRAIDFLGLMRTARWRKEQINLVASAVKLYPLKPQYHFMLAQLYERSGNKHKAMAEYTTALALHEQGGDDRAKLSDSELSRARSVTGQLP